MLRIVVCANSAQAKNYFKKSLSREEYYSEGQELVGYWQGYGAERLGLSGRVDQQSFNELADNLKPGTDETLTARMKENRRVGYDFNFNCPKSVSVLYEQERDERIVEAFKCSVTQTMREVEADMHTRVRTQGRDEDRKTGNMVWAEFHHFTARPVNGVPDPHLHAHCFAFNATWDDAEQRWKAGQFGQLKREGAYYEAVFHARFAKRLADLGYGIERTEKGWEIAGVPQSVIEKFIHRAKEVEALALERGITTAKGRDSLAAYSRERKNDGITKEELREVWNNRLTPEERTAMARLTPNGRKVELPDGALRLDQITPKKAMDYAVAHCYERASVVTENELLREALRHGVGAVEVEQVRRQLMRDDFIKQENGGQCWLTTRHILAEERKLLAFTREGKGVCEPLNSRGYQIQDEKLLRPEGREQREAVQHVLSSRDRVIAVRGGAGTGKTTMLKEAVAGIEAGGHKVFAFAPSAEASRGVLREAGFENATTVAAFLHSAKMQEGVRNGVLLVDEAGLLSSPQLKQVVELAQRQNCRVLLSGDTAQHGAVERGDALRLLEKHAGLQAAELRHIRRQLHPTYRAAIADLRQGDVENGFAKLNALGAIKETSADSRYQQLAADYVQSVKDNKTALVVSPTHAEGERVTTEIRKELKALQKLGADERLVPQLKNLRWTEAQRADASRYQPGLVIQFHQNVPGFRRGEKISVTAKDQNHLLVQRADGTGDLLRLGEGCRASAFNVYSTGVLPVTPGEWIRITQNGYSRDGHRLNNGELRRVKGFDKQGDLILDNGWVVAKDYGNLAHGYCVTSHGSQGKSVQRLLVAESEESLPAASREQFYVSASRGVEKIQIYTDNKEALMDAVSRSRQRPSATDLVKRTWPEDLKEKNRRKSQRREADTRKKARAKQVKLANKKKFGPVKKIAPVQRQKIVPPEIKPKNYYGMSL